MIVRKKDGRVRLFSRRGYDWTDRFPLIREAVANIRASALVLDGEAVCCDPDGTANFELLHSRAHEDRALRFLKCHCREGGSSARQTNWAVDPIDYR
jgi:ATP-dependent DNA ligase